MPTLGPRILILGFLFCTSAVLRGVVDGEVDEKALILAALVAALLTGLYTWYRVRRG